MESFSWPLALDPNACRVCFKPVGDEGVEGPIIRLKLIFRFLGSSFVVPRQARLDAPGSLHHVIGPRIERRGIFSDDMDNDDFIARLSRLFIETQTALLRLDADPQPLSSAVTHRFNSAQQADAPTVDRLCGRFQPSPPACRSSVSEALQVDHTPGRALSVGSGTLSPFQSIAIALRRRHRRKPTSSQISGFAEGGLPALQ